MSPVSRRGFSAFGIQTYFPSRQLAAFSRLVILARVAAAREESPSFHLSFPCILLKNLRRIEEVLKLTPISDVWGD